MQCLDFDFLGLACVGAEETVGWGLSSSLKKILQEEQMGCGCQESDNSEMTCGSWLWTQAGNDTRH